MTDVAPAVDEVRAAIAALHAAAIVEFGWTHMKLEVTAGDSAGAVRVSGTVAARGVIARLRRLCPPSISVDVDDIAVLTTGDFVGLPGGGATLYRRPDRLDDATRTTELDEGDGPVELLERLDGVALVRASDGTVGWTPATLGATTPWRPGFARIDLAAIDVEHAAWLGAPYKLGGTRRAGVDCSGLVSRLLQRAGVRLPRHSADQILIGPSAGLGAGLGDIVAIWSADEAPCHVGLGLSGDRVIHASRSRARVVVESRAEFVARAVKVVHVPGAELVRFAEATRTTFDLLGALKR